MHIDTELAAWTVAALLLDKLQLPEDLLGRTVNLVEFPDSKTCEFFFPGRTLRFHRTINTLIEREVRSRGGSVSKTTITAQTTSETNATEETRRAKAERHYSLSSLKSGFPDVS